MFYLDYKSGLPIYEQLYRSVTKMAAAGIMEADEKLPAVRALAMELGINPNTVQKSYAMLEEEGLLHSRPGAKSCIRVNPEAISRLRQEILIDGIRAMVENMKQMGMTCAEAQETIARLWEVET